MVEGLPCSRKGVNGGLTVNRRRLAVGAILAVASWALVWSSTPVQASHDGSECVVDPSGESGGPFERHDAHTEAECAAEATALGHPGNYSWVAGAGTTTTATTAPTTSTTSTTTGATTSTTTGGIFNSCNGETPYGEWVWELGGGGEFDAMDGDWHAAERCDIDEGFEAGEPRSTWGCRQAEPVQVYLGLCLAGLQLWAGAVPASGMSAPAMWWADYGEPVNGTWGYARLTPAGGGSTFGVVGVPTSPASPEWRVWQGGSSPTSGEGMPLYSGPLCFAYQSGGYLSTFERLLDASYQDIAYSNLAAYSGGEGGPWYVWRPQVLPTAPTGRIYCGGSLPGDAPAGSVVSPDPGAPDGGTDDGQVPRIACGRTLRPVGGGQVFADLEGVTLNPREGAFDQAWWTTSYDDDGAGANHDGLEATTALPAPVPSDGSSARWYAELHVQRTYLDRDGVGGFEAQGHWVDGGEGEPDFWVPDLSSAPAFFVDFLGDIAEFWLLYNVPGPVSTIDYLWEQLGWGSRTVLRDENGDALDGPDWTAGDSWRSAEVTCRVPLDPLREWPGPVTGGPPENPPDDPGGPGDPPPPTGGGGEGGSGSCFSGVDWWNPFSWVGGVACALPHALAGMLDDLLDAILGLVEALGELLVTLFVPEDLDFEGLTAELQGGFPFSVLADGVELVTGLSGALEAGMTNRCGPSLDVGLDDLVLERLDPEADVDALRPALPTPAEASAECGTDEMSAQAADLAGWREPARALAGIVVWIAFVWRVAHSIGPRRRDEGAG